MGLKSAAVEKVREMTEENTRFTAREALNYHAKGRPGKIEIVPSKPMATQRDLSLAYSPGVAVPVEEIAKDESKSYDYTARGNLVAVISNGTAILGLGNLGPSAAKPVMEGKAVLFKRFADIDSIDLEVATEDVDAFVDCVKLLGPSFGGINLEDIKAPECFIIEQRLRELMDIPVFHDDQHGTAIITAAGFINAVHLTGRDIKKTKIVMNGAGAASIACCELLKAMGVPHGNVVLCDSKGVIYQGRAEGMNQWKSAHAVVTDVRTLEEAMAGADCFIGLSVKGAVTGEMVAGMAARPIIFAMANPDPEITPEEVRALRDDAIVATGRSDYPNQVNNVLGFPYIFRGALDVRASTINDEMKIAAAEALAELARADVPDEVMSAYSGERPRYGADYIIPAPFDPRLIEHVPVKVAEAAMKSGVARRPLDDMEAYANALKSRLNPTFSILSNMFERLRQSPPKRVVFAEGEEERVIRAAIGFRDAGYGIPILIGHDEIVRARLRDAGVDPDSFEIHNARISPHYQEYVDYLYRRLNRKGFLYRDVQRKVNRDRNVFGAAMVKLGHADAMVTGVTRHFWQVLNDVEYAIDPLPGELPFGMTILLRKGHPVFLADTLVNEKPGASELAEIAIHSAAAVRSLGYEPRVAFLSFANFGNPTRESTAHIREAVKILETRAPDFEFDGEMSPDVALREDMRHLYPFCRLTGPANVLILPNLSAGNISYKLLSELGGNSMAGPLLWGLEKSVQIARMASKTSDLVALAAFAAIAAKERL